MFTEDSKSGEYQTQWWAEHAPSGGTGRGCLSAKKFWSSAQHTPGGINLMGGGETKEERVELRKNNFTMWFFNPFGQLIS